MAVKKADRHIYLMSLIFTDDYTTHALIEALITAKKRGVIVNVAVDSFTYSELGGYFSPFKRHANDSRIATINAKRLVTAGVSFTWLGKTHKLNPFSGVTHSKWSVVDDTIYTFGGVNLYRDGIESTDYMLRLTDPTIADYLIGQHKMIVTSTNQNYNGGTQKTSLGTIYIDSGKPNQSLIYDRACTLAKTAAHITYVSQYCPTGPLTKFINQTDHELYFNQPQYAGFPTNVMVSWDKFLTGLTSSYRRKTYLHAKFIIFTQSDGSKIALTGSHNFSHKGVVFGTREIALETTDSTIILQLEKFNRQFIL
jgi:cardiolipin synthase A/B